MRGGRLVIAIYPGTFDPITFGHMDVVKRATGIFSSVIIAIPDISVKNNLLEISKRAEIINQLYQDNDSVSVEVFSGLLVDWMTVNGHKIIVRGFRDSVDMANEWRMAHCNQVLSKSIETLFLAASPEVSHISSSLVREVILCGASIKPFVPSIVAENIDL